MNEQQNANVRDQIGTKDGQYPPTKLMIIEVEVKLILMVPEPKKGELAADFVLAAEHFINRLQGFNTSDTHTAVGVRIHMKDYKVTS